MGSTAPLDEVTLLLRRLESGEDSALAQIFTATYDDMRQLARRQLRGRGSGSTLSTTVLVHEVYVRLSASKRAVISDSEHLKALCARAMRQVIIDHVRAGAAQKRGRGSSDTTLEEDFVPEALDVEREASFLLDLDAALTALDTSDPRLARVAELRFFGGFGVEEVAGILGVSSPTVKRDSRLARAFLQRALDGSRALGP